jgi:Domain of unknown function (DUF4279)
MAKPDTDKNYAYISVTSLILDPERVTEICGLTPDEAFHLGDNSQIRGRTKTFHHWARYLDVVEGVHLGTEGLSKALEELGVESAKRFKLVSEAGGEVTCAFVQKVHGDTDFWATGIHLSASALEWLATAQAELDIDQYFSVDALPESA